jgi:hypothetical protein
LWNQGIAAYPTMAGELYSTRSGEEGVKMKTVLSKLIVACLSLMSARMILTGIGSTEITSETIVGVWLFDEGNGQKARDYSGKSDDGELMNAPKWVDGKFGKAIEFDGKDDYVEISLPDVFNDIPNKDFTISFWINVQDISGSDTVWTRILEARHDNSNYVQFDIQINAGELGINIVDAGTERTFIVDSPISPDTWYHVTGVWDADEDRVGLYLNGVFQSKIGTIPASPGTQKILNLGRRSDGSDMSHFDGIMDEFAIFTTPLTEEGIEILMEDGLRAIAAVSSSGKLVTTWGKLKNFSITQSSQAD